MTDFSNLARGGALYYDTKLGTIVNNNADGTGADPYQSKDTTFTVLSPNNDTLASQQASQQTATNAATQNYNRDYLNSQSQQLRDLLGRIATGEAQGLQKNEQEYKTQLDAADKDKTAQMAEYGNQETQQGLGKEKAFTSAGRNAGNSYRSLSQILGRAGGTGSSAFQELLPNAIGKGLNENRTSAIGNYGENMQNIGKAKNKYESSFEEVLKDLMTQKLANESTLKSGVEGQRQNVYGQQATNAAQLAENKNPNASFSAIQAAQNPYKQAIDNSLNTVEGFFNKYNTPFTPKAAVKEAPALSGFTTDRAAINAQGQGMDASNPYASILRKKLLQEGA